MKSSAMPCDSEQASITASLVRDVSRAWVEKWREQLAKDGRAMVGGWPGTRAEAHALVVDRIAPALAGKAFTSSEWTMATTRELYAVARKEWLAAAARER